MRTFTILLLTIILASCKKSAKDSNPPEVSFLDPKYDRSMYGLQDTLKIKVSAKDDLKLSSFKVSVTEDASTTPDFAFNKITSNNAVMIDTFFVFKSKSAGYYKIKIEATDAGSNVTSKVFTFEVMDM